MTDSPDRPRQEIINLELTLAVQDRGPRHDTLKLSDEEVETLIDAVERLPEPDRTIIEAAFWGRLTEREIGAKFGRNKQWAHRCKVRAYKQLREILNGETNREPN